MIYGSVCSGIEAATVAWHPLGWSPAFFSEIDKFPRAVLKKHYPDIPLHGDFTTIKAKQYVAIDLLVGGTPCQDFSIAGLRKGITAERGHLTLEFLLLAKRLRPKWLVWENVPGVFSSTSHASPPDTRLPPDDMEEGSEWVGEDEYDSDENHALACFLSGLSELGYGYAYRTLDAQYFGLAQRRRRLFVIGYLGDWRCAAAVLFERESMQWNPAPSREARQSLTHDVAPCIGASGRGFERGGESRGLDPVIAVESSSGSVAHCLNAGGMGRQDFETETLVTHALRGKGHDASEDGTGRRTPLVTSISPCLRAGGNKTGGDRPPGTDVDTVDSLIVIPILEAGARSNTTIPINTQMGLRGPETSNTLREGIGIGQEGDPMFTLQAAHHYAVAFVQNSRDEVRFMGGDGDSVGALSAAPRAKQQCYVAFDLRGRDGGAQAEGEHDTANIRASSGGSSRSYIAGAMAVRRLTPRECERLQGFPDDYTKINDKTADGPRYKALGNSMAVPVMRWLGERIQMVEEMTQCQ